MNSHSISIRKHPHLFHFLHALSAFVRHNIVFCIAFSVALATVVVVPPDKEYLHYIDFRTIACLFCTLAVVGALKNIRFFTYAARRIVEVFVTLRSAVLALVMITFIGSMLIANDMALLTFLPLGWLVLSETNETRYTAITFVMQNIAANLGGMLTPFGNPQNMYLYSYFNISNGDFVATMLIPFLLSLLFIVSICLIFVPKSPLTLSKAPVRTLPRARLITYFSLFALSLAMVFRTIPVAVCTVIVILALLTLDRKALKDVDYPLLLTFVSFFIFSSNLARIETISLFFSGLVSYDTLLVSTLSSQVISNVPTAILFSRFSNAWQPLLLGVNIGGVGSPISSLASLITLREFQERNLGHTRRFLLLFLLYNFAFLFLLFTVCKLFLYFS